MAPPTVSEDVTGATAYVIHSNVGEFKNIIQPFHGPNRDLTVERFFDLIDQATKLGSWNEEHKVVAAKLFLSDQAQEYLEGEEDLKVAPYDAFKASLIECFSDKD